MIITPFLGGLSELKQERHSKALFLFLIDILYIMFVVVMTFLPEYFEFLHFFRHIHFSTIENKASWRKSWEIWKYRLYQNRTEECGILDGYEWNLSFRTYWEKKSKRNHSLDFDVLHNDVIKFSFTVMNTVMKRKFENEPFSFFVNNNVILRNIGFLKLYSCYTFSFTMNW